MRSVSVCLDVRDVVYWIIRNYMIREESVFGFPHTALAPHMADFLHREARTGGERRAIKTCLCVSRKMPQNESEALAETIYKHDPLQSASSDQK